jgi:hypothetical protein
MKISGTSQQKTDQVRYFPPQGHANMTTKKQDKDSCHFAMHARTLIRSSRTRSSWFPGYSTQSAARHTIISWLFILNLLTPPPPTPLLLATSRYRGKRPGKNGLVFFPPACLYGASHCLSVYLFIRSYLCLSLCIFLYGTPRKGPKTKRPHYKTSGDITYRTQSKIL